MLDKLHTVFSGSLRLPKAPLPHQAYRVCDAHRVHRRPGICELVRACRTLGKGWRARACFEAFSGCYLSEIGKYAPWSCMANSDSPGLAAPLASVSRSSPSRACLRSLLISALAASVVGSLSLRLAWIPVLVSTLHTGTEALWPSSCLA